MTLSGIERDFLNRASLQAWTSPPLFDHRLLDRLVEARYVTRRSAPAKALKSQRGLKKSESLRDAMSLPELTYVMAAESLATERIEEIDPQGATPCQIAVRTSATFIREAIEKDRASRNRPTFG